MPTRWGPWSKWARFGESGWMLRLRWGFGENRAVKFMYKETQYRKRRARKGVSKP